VILLTVFCLSFR